MLTVPTLYLTWYFFLTILIDFHFFFFFIYIYFVVNITRTRVVFYFELIDVWISIKKYIISFVIHLFSAHYIILIK